MRAGKALGLVSLFAVVLSSQAASVFAGGEDKKADRGRGLDLKNVPIEVIQAAQKEVPTFGFMTVEKQRSWRGRESYRIWGMDNQQRQLYMEISASGKIIEKPKLVKQEKQPEKQTEKAPEKLAERLQPIPQQ